MARVLVIDDDARVLAAAVDALEALGHSPLACGDEAAALGFSAGEIGSIDLALVDVHLPDAPAGRLIRVLAERYPGLPLVAMSGESVPGGLPVADFLGKPFSLADLRRVVADLESTRPADLRSNRPTAALSVAGVSKRLHDEVSQPLVGARLAVDLVLAGHGDPREALERIAPALAEALDALRRLLHDLLPEQAAR